MSAEIALFPDEGKVQFQQRQTKKRSFCEFAKGMSR